MTLILTKMASLCLLENQAMPDTFIHGVNTVRSTAIKLSQRINLPADT